MPQGLIDDKLWKHVELFIFQEASHRPVAAMRLTGIHGSRVRAVRWHPVGDTDQGDGLLLYDVLASMAGMTTGARL